jgi:hypothetical protein
LFGTDAAVGGVFCDAPNLATGHQYGLQIVEGMVRFFESHEQELEKYWTKISFSNSAEEYRRHLIPVLRGDISRSFAVWRAFVVFSANFGLAHRETFSL